MKNYNIDNGVLVQYNGKATRPSIPKDVTEIGAWAFFGCDTLTSVNIPSSVIKIGSNAFNSCENLKSIKIPKSVKDIGWSTFSGCSNLTNIVIPDSVKNIETHAFNGCENLKSINIPNNVTYIGFCAFNEIKKVEPQFNTNGTLRAFKAFNKDWTCRKFQYEVGKAYHQDGKINCCNNGFHACPNPLDVFNYYYGDLDEMHFAEVELSGEMHWEEDKVAASDIKIVRELTISELAEIYNSMEKC